MKRIFLALISVFLCLITLFSAAGCSSAPRQSAETKTAEIQVSSLPESTTAETEPVVTEEPPYIPEFVNPYTGLETTEEAAKKRPVAVMFNNLYESLPQRSLSRCEIVYEVLAEGGILRMCGIMTDYENAPDVGSMRSARPYYLELAMANDAIFVHAGGTQVAYDMIADLKIDDIDGARRGPFSVNGKQVFFRDQERIKKRIAIEHTLFTSGEMITAAIGAKGYRTELADPDFRAFSFRYEPEPLGTGKEATFVTIPHSRYSVSKFQFDPETGVYLHSQYNEPHIDEVNGEQIRADNLFILYAKHSLYPGQTVTAYQIIDLVGEGEGVYCWGGEMTEIKWKRDSRTGTFSYFDAEGNELAVNPGRSYVVVANRNIKDKVTFTETN